MNEYWDRLTRYADGEMSEEEAMAFKEELEDDYDLREDLSLYQSMKENLSKQFSREEKVEAFKQNLDKIISESDAENTKEGNGRARIKYLIWVGVTAAAIFLAIIIFQESRDLYTTYNQHQPLALTTRTVDEQSIARIEQVFNRGNYDKAFTQLDSLAKTSNQHRSRVRLYRAISLMELNRLEEARTDLENIAAGQSSLVPEANWYLAMTYLKENKIKKAAPFLEKIPQGHFRYKQATEILSQIE